MYFHYSVSPSPFYSFQFIFPIRYYLTKSTCSFYVSRPKPLSDIILLHFCFYTKAFLKTINCNFITLPLFIGSSELIDFMHFTLSDSPHSFAKISLFLSVVQNLLNNFNYISTIMSFLPPSILLILFLIICSVIWQSRLVLSLFIDQFLFQHSFLTHSFYRVHFFNYFYYLPKYYWYLYIFTPTSS